MTSVTALHPSQTQSAAIPAGQVPVNGLPRTAEGVHRGHVRTSLNFYEPPKDGAVPFNYVEQPPEGKPQTNFGCIDKEVDIRDVRGRESEFDLDEHAFKTVQGYPHNEKIDWNDDESIKTHYYPEVEKILLDHTKGAKRVLLFDHTIRRAVPNAHRAPVARTHIDQTPKSAALRVEYHLPEEKDELLKGRYWITNVWRPLNGPVESFPLAFASSNTVQDSDVVPVEHRYPHRTGETAAIKYNPSHQWNYWSGIDNSERILLQCFDSKYPMNRVPHTAFTDPRSTENSKSRESIEVRALIFGDL